MPHWAHGYGSRPGANVVEVLIFTTIASAGGKYGKLAISLIELSDRLSQAK
jgi:hypothetical protein